MGSASGELAPSAAGRLWSARRMVITVHESGGAETTVPVDRPFARIGRDRRAEVHVNGPSVLPCQLYLHATDEGIYCLSLSADASSGWLTAGSKVRVGDHRVSAAFAEGPPARAGTADLCARHGAVEPVPLVTVAAGRQQIAIRDVAVHRQLTLIGRQPPGTLCVRHRTISRAHCVLFWDGGQLWLVDLLSSNGTRLEGERFDAGAIPQGGTFRLGDIRFHFATTAPLEQDRLHSDSGSGLLDVPSDSDLLPGVPADASHVAEAVHSAGIGARRADAAESGQPRRGMSEWDARFRELTDELRQQRAETERMLAAREAADAQQAQAIEQLENALADALNATQRERDAAVGEAAEREAKLAAMGQSLTSLEEKLARTEAKLAAPPAEPADDRQAAAALEERLQSLAGQLVKQRQQQSEERASLQNQLAAHEAAEAKQAQQLALLETKLADALTTAQQERELLLGEAAEREATLTAMGQSLTSLEEKLARTEAKLAAPPAEPADDGQAKAMLEERLQSLAEQLAKQRQQQSDERTSLQKQLAAHEAAEAKQAQQLAILETNLVDVLTTAQQERELLLGEAAERDATLAAMGQSLTSLEEKLARTETRLTAAPAEPADGGQAKAMWEERFQTLAGQLAEQRQVQSDERAGWEKQLAAQADARQTEATWEERFQALAGSLTRQRDEHARWERKLADREAVEAAQSEQLAALNAELASVLNASRQERDSILAELTDREGSLAAMHQSLASLEEKLARTEAQLAATSAQAADGDRAASAWEQRFHDLEAQLTRQGEEIIARDAALIGRETSDDAPTREALVAIEKRFVPLEARLTALTEQVNSPIRQTMAGDSSRPAAPSGEWMLDDEHTRRLLAFRHKRENTRRWRQLAWAAAASLIAIGAVVAGVLIHQRDDSAANRPPAPGSEAGLGTTEK